MLMITSYFRPWCMGLLPWHWTFTHSFPKKIKNCFTVRKILRSSEQYSKIHWSDSKLSEKNLQNPWKIGENRILRQKNRLDDLSFFAIFNRKLEDFWAGITAGFRGSQSFLRSNLSNKRSGNVQFCLKWEEIQT